MLVIWRYIGALEVPGGGSLVGRFATAVTIVYEAGADDEDADDNDDDGVANYVARDRGEFETSEGELLV